jgi:glutaconate CoA-transferase subunit A
MKEAISEFVEDGDSVAMGTALEAAIPFSAAHEMIRQGKKELTLIGPISDMLFDQMIGSSCVKKVIAAWVGNVIMGVGYNARRALEKGIPRKTEMVDYTNFTIALALQAGAMDIPFIPTKSLLGTGMMEGDSPFKEMDCPFTQEWLALVPALRPDVAIVQAQRADEEGNTHFWGGSGVTKEAALAARKVIVVVEEVVSKKVIQRDPNRTLISETKEIFLDSLHPGVSMEEVLENTGWNLKLASRIKKTRPPTRSELRIIRKYDLNGFWTKNVDFKSPE